MSFASSVVRPRAVAGSLLLVAAGVLVTSVIGHASAPATDAPAAGLVLDARQGLPAGTGRDALERVCSGCHDLSFALSVRETEDEWARIVGEMRSKGADGTEEDFSLAIGYLAEHMGRPAATSRNQTHHAELAVLADRTKVAPGERFTLGLRVVAEPGWRLRGEPGQPAQVTWVTPADLSIGEPRWAAAPAPEILSAFPASLSPTTAVGATLEVRAQVSYRICQVDSQDVCVAETGTASTILPIGVDGLPNHIEDFASLRSDARR